MSIFDELSPEQISKLLSMNQNSGLDLTIAGQSQPPNLWNPQLQSSVSQAPTVPQVPQSPDGQGDVSGFAGYGMEAPKIPEAMQQMSGLMGMMGDPRTAQRERKQIAPSLPQGGLMAYLQSLGV